MTTKKQWWKDQGLLLSDFKRLNPWFRTEKDEKFITNEKINFETNGALLKCRIFFMSTGYVIWYRRALWTCLSSIESRVLSELFYAWTHNNRDLRQPELRRHQLQKHWQEKTTFWYISMEDVINFSFYFSWTSKRHNSAPGKFGILNEMEL